MYLSSSAVAKKCSGLTLEGFCHLLDAIESEIKRFVAGKTVDCYLEDDSLLPDEVYQEIIESVLLKTD